MVTVHIKDDALEYAKNLDSDTRNKINERMAELERNFKKYSKSLKANLKGLRSINITRKHRIVFAVCRECRDSGWEELNKKRCGCCGTLPLDAIHVIKIGPRKNVYDDKRDSKLKSGKKRKKKKK